MKTVNIVFLCINAALLGLCVHLEWRYRQLERHPAMVKLDDGREMSVFLDKEPFSVTPPFKKAIPPPTTGALDSECPEGRRIVTEGTSVTNGFVLHWHKMPIFFHCIDLDQKGGTAVIIFPPTITTPREDVAIVATFKLLPAPEITNVTLMDGDIMLEDSDADGFYDRRFDLSRRLVETLEPPGTGM